MCCSELSLTEWHQTASEGGITPWEPQRAPVGAAPGCPASSKGNPKEAEVEVSKQVCLSLKQQLSHTEGRSRPGGQLRYRAPTARQHQHTLVAVNLLPQRQTITTKVSSLVHEICCERSCPVTAVFTTAQHPRANHAAEITNFQLS